MQQSPASFLDWTSQFATEDACLFKRFLLGTFHGVSGKYLQEYLDESCSGSTAATRSSITPRKKTNEQSTS